VLVFGCRHDVAIRALRRPATEKRQGTKSREVGDRLGNGRYGDFMRVPMSMMGGRPGRRQLHIFVHRRGRANAGGILADVERINVRSAH